MSSGSKRSSMIGEDYFGKLGEEFFYAPTEQVKVITQSPAADSGQDPPAAKVPSKII